MGTQTCNPSDIYAFLSYLSGTFSGFMLYAFLIQEREKCFTFFYMFLLRCRYISERLVALFCLQSIWVADTMPHYASTIVWKGEEGNTWANCVMSY